MALTYTKWGVGTVSVGDTPINFESECEGAVITHEYEDTGEERTMLDGQTIPASAKRTDGFTATIVNSLSAGALYDFLQTNDLTEQAFTFTPNTADGANWAGTVQVRLPADIGADEFGNPIVSEIEWSGVGPFVWTPTVVPPGTARTNK